jgi:pyruvate kinase
MRQTKIIATIGPASRREEVLRGLLAGGVDVCRLNFSHGTHDSHADVIGLIRRLSDEMRRPVAILQDLGGPKIRTGRLRGGEPILLAPGDQLTIAVGDFAGEPGRISTTYADLPRGVKRGDTLLLDDGRIELRVDATDHREEIRTVVVDGGVLGEQKGINAPGVELPSVGLTPKDAVDLAFGVASGVDYVALSFVQSAADIRHARDALRRAGAPLLPIIAKLERPEALSRLEQILASSDAVMVARGDLGLELPLERVPRVQKEITRRARALGVPVIVATQVLESMRTEPRPTRAEVSDAANAVDDGVDAIMLAGETAIGTYPVRAVQMLDLVIRDAESIPPVAAPVFENTFLLTGHGRAICDAAVTLAERGNATAIVAITRGGKTARVLSALRPRVPIVAATDRQDIARRLVLPWGVVPVLTDLSGDVNAAASRISEELVAGGVISRPSTIVVVSITPDLAAGPSNFLKLQRV